MRSSTLATVLVVAMAIPAGVHLWRVSHAGAANLSSSSLIPSSASEVSVSRAVRFDRSAPLASLRGRASRTEPADCGERDRPCGLSPVDPDDVAQAQQPPAEPSHAALGTSIEQTAMGTRPAAKIAASFDGLGAGFTGPQGTAPLRNPSDNSLAAGPDDLVQIVNSRMAIFTKQGATYPETGKVLYGPVATNTVFKGFGGACETRLSGDAVVRYDQLAGRWLFVLPVFQRAADVASPPAPQAGAPAAVSVPGRQNQPGDSALLFVPPPPEASPTPAAPRAGAPGAARGAGGRAGQPPAQGPYSMCYAVSTSSDPLGEYFRYEFLRPLFPDYPRPAVWPDGYYVPTSTSDNPINPAEGVFTEKHACVADRVSMLNGQPATEQCVILHNVSFLNNADVDGQTLPPVGAPNVMMAAGGTQLKKVFEDDGIYAYQFHVDWQTPANTKVTGPVKIPVAPYHFLCDGQLSNCVPQPGTERRLDAQGDKIMQRVVYRTINGQESIFVEHSVNTAAVGGGVRWYEFRFNEKHEPVLYQQGTYAPGGGFRWMASGGIDRQGDIAMGYSFGGLPNYAGQRFAGRLAGDPLGQLTLQETVLATGEASQTNTVRWEDYTTSAMDPVDDCTFWYVGDYLKKDATAYASRIAGVRLPGCERGTVRGSAYFDLNHNGRRDAGEPGLRGWTLAYSGARSGSFTSDADGTFGGWLPADPLYGDPAYTFAAPPAPGPAWTLAPPPPPLKLTDRADIVGLDFGGVCTVTNSGGHDAASWAKNRGMVNAIDPEWRTIVNSTLFLVEANGARMLIPSDGDRAADALRAWLRGASGANPSYRLSQALAAAAFNVAAGTEDGGATLSDPVARDWTTIDTFVSRVSRFISAHPQTPADGSARQAADLYTSVLEKLNGNTLAVTPSDPAKCGK